MTDEVWLALAMVLTFGFLLVVVPYEVIHYGGGLRRMGFRTDWHPISTGFWILTAVQQFVLFSILILMWMRVFGVLPEAQWILDRWPYKK